MAAEACAAPKAAAMVPLSQTPAAAALAAASGMTIQAAAEAFAKSRYFDVQNVTQAVAKIAHGRSIGLSDGEAMTGLYFTNGKITMSYPLMAALIKRSGRYRYVVKELTDKGCSIEFYEKIENCVGGVVSWAWEKCGPASTFTEENAKVAGLTNVNYKKFPRNMLFARALSNGARWYCPDALGGSPTYLPDEIPGSGLSVNYETGEVADAEVVETAAKPAPPTPTEPRPSMTAPTAKKPPTRADLEAELTVLVAETKTEWPKLLAHYERKAAADLNMQQLGDAVRLLRDKKDVMPAAALAA